MSPQKFELVIWAIVVSTVAVPLALVLALAVYRKGRDWLAVRLEERARFIRAERLNRYRTSVDFSVGKAPRIWIR